MKSNQNILLFLIVTSMLFSKLSFCQTSKKKLKKENVIESELYVIDTIVIQDPVILIFDDSNYNEQYEPEEHWVLISKSKLDSLDFMRNVKFEDFIFKEGYLFYAPIIFRGLLEVVLLRNEKAPKHLKKLLKDINAYDNTELQFCSTDVKNYKGWKYREVNTNRFIFCLIKGSFVEKMAGEETIIVVNPKNLYYKTLLPLQW